MAASHPSVSLVLWVAPLLVGACAPAELPAPDVAAIQWAAATEISASIAEASGPIVTICVGYEGDAGVPGLPSFDAPSPVVAGRDACREVDGRLTATDGGGPAVAVSVREPEAFGALRARVAVFTSTGGGDLAAYSCTVRQEDGAWRSDGCSLDAIS